MTHFLVLQERLCEIKENGSRRTCQVVNINADFAFCDGNVLYCRTRTVSTQLLSQIITNLLASTFNLSLYGVF